MFIRMILLFVFSLLLGLNTLSAQDTTKVRHAGKHHKFVDKDGDGYNDNAPDHDGDGIPNGLDPDWQKIVKYKGRGPGQGKGHKRKFIDLDGDGINDYLQGYGEETDKGNKNMLSKDKGSAMDHQGRKGKGSPKRKQAGRH